MLPWKPAHVDAVDTRELTLMRVVKVLFRCQVVPVRFAKSAVCALSRVRFMPEITVSVVT